MSDIHVKDDEVSKTGMKKALTYINQLKTKPSFIINGGDSIMDALAADKTNTSNNGKYGLISSLHTTNCRYITVLAIMMYGVGK